MCQFSFIFHVCLIMSFIHVRMTIGENPPRVLNTPHGHLFLELIIAGDCRADGSVINSSKAFYLRVERPV